MKTSHRLSRMLGFALAGALAVTPIVGCSSQDAATAQEASVDVPAGTYGPKDGGTDITTKDDVVAALTTLDGELKGDDATGDVLDADFTTDSDASDGNYYTMNLTYFAQATDDTTDSELSSGNAVWSVYENKNIADTIYNTFSIGDDGMITLQAGTSELTGISGLYPTVNGTDLTSFKLVSLGNDDNGKAQYQLVAQQEAVALTSESSLYS